jgi:predicted permease
MTVGLLLCAGCITVGMLLLIRTEARRGELAMCRALGASRARLAAGIALEGTLLAAAGAVAAVPVAYWLFGAIGSFQLPGRIGIASLELSVDPRFLSVLAAAAIAGVVVISAIGGVFGFRANVADALRGPAGATPRVRRNLSRAALVSAQMAVAVFLVCGAGVFGRSVLAALSLNSDIEPHRILAGGEFLTPYGYDPQRAGVLFDEFRARLQRHPGVEGIAFHRFQGAMPEQVVFDGIPTQVPGLVTFLAVNPDYYRVMRLQVLAGRGFSPADGQGAPGVAIVSESLARVLTGSRNAVGRRVADAGRINVPPVQVVGVVSDLIDVVTQLEPLVVYLPLAQTPPSVRSDFVIRVAGGQVGTVRREIARVFEALDPAILPRPVQTLEERIGRQMQSQQFAGTVLGALGVIAVLLTLLGAYVLADSMATMRMREMGIRAALGATRRQLGSLVLAETGRLIGIGILAGLGLAWLGAGTIRAFLFQVEPLDPITLGGVSALILALTLAVSLRGALRVARVDLAQVLRAE